MQHKGLAAGRWFRLSLAEQLGNVGSEVSRAVRWKNKDDSLFEKTVIRALELLDLTIGDARWKGRLKELTRLREFLCDAWLDGAEHGTQFQDLDRYLLQFAIAARKNRK